MIRALAVVSALGALAGPVRADSKSPAPAEPAQPDEIADTEAREANLESNAPRSGVTFAVALVGGIMLGGDVGVGRGPGGSLRLGHVATRKTVITFEAVGTGALHKPAMTSKTLTDSSIGVLVGAQRYTSPSVWVRIAGGLDTLTKDIGAGAMRPSPQGGAAGLLGGGLDLARWGYLVLGLETFAMASVTADGFKVQLGFGMGLSYY